MFLISWYRSQVRVGGLGAATSLLFKVVSSRLRVRFANHLLPGKVTCPCCGWEGRVFADYIELGYQVRNAECPRCNSHPRHRMLLLRFAELIPDRGANSGEFALVFAPERSLEALWASNVGLTVIRADREAARGVDLLLDLQRLPLSSDRFDLIWCHHVLEHVPDDRAAMGELFRVLRPGAGTLIVSVPMGNGLSTREYGFADPTISYHWREYGADFADRLKGAGFRVRPLELCLTDLECERYGIRAEPVFLCSKAPA